MDSKFDLFGMFIERNLDLAQKQGLFAMITMQSWMFLSSFETLRARLLKQNTILSMAHLGAKAFDSIGGEVVFTTAFIIKNAQNPVYRGSFIKLIEGNKELFIRDWFECDFGKIEWKEIKKEDASQSDAKWFFPYTI